MPQGGVADRANQVSTLRRIGHQRFTSEVVGRLLEAAADEVAGREPDSFEASLVRVTRRDYDDMVKLPAGLVARQAREETISHPIWVEAKRLGDWALFEPRMAVTVELARQTAEALGYQDRPYDALIGLSEPGLTTARMEALFSQLKAEIVPFLGAVAERADRVDDSVLSRPCAAGPQLAFSLEVIQELGYELERGRQDLSAHPFCTAFGPGDVRLTTRTGKTLFDSCVFSSIHESGHGMYYQGVPRALDRTPLWGGASPGVHESQSRLWENLVGRSLPFWRHFMEPMRAHFGSALDGCDAEGFYRAVNRVQPSYSRVDADEVTYNLHVMLRCEIENDLLEGRLAVADVPEVWNAKLQEYLGLAPAPVANGPLQDIHWTFPSLGSFIGYTMGNLISAQLMETVRRDLPDLDARVEAGDFAALLGWLRANVHSHGRKLTPNELVERITGKPIQPGPWVAYVRRKYSELYGID